MKTKSDPVTFSRSPFALNLVIIGVAFNGLIFIGGTLLDEFLIRNRLHTNDVAVGISLIAGLTLLYLSSLLARHKRAAWMVTIPVYAFILGFYNIPLILSHGHNIHHNLIGHVLRYIILPSIVICGLIYYKSEFRVRSDIQNFHQSLRFVAIVLSITLLYGVTGFTLMDKHDFHQEINFVQAIQHTIDQFGLTTSHSLIPYTRRAKLFMDSLSIISLGSVGYAVISLFQPLRARFVDQGRNRHLVEKMLFQYPASSEDFFKLWPTDKLYFLSDDYQSALALRVHRGKALVVGDPAGDSKSFDSLLNSFCYLCYHNDWSAAFIHTDNTYRQLYEKFGFKLQKIGEEAIVDIDHFQTSVKNNKYFRHINNKFTKFGYNVEILTPPHSPEIIDALRAISAESLDQPGRTERGFMMGYFSNDYMQACPIHIVRDNEGRICAFVNQIYSFDKEEANFDLLRHSTNSPGNINDYLMVNFIDEMSKQGFKRCNLGLCPLTGLDKQQENESIVDSTLRFVYANGDRLYSFSGLHRFKSKYEPNWSSRYIVYRGGVREFTKILSALNQAMKVSKQKLRF